MASLLIGRSQPDVSIPETGPPLQKTWISWALPTSYSGPGGSSHVLLTVGVAFSVPLDGSRGDALDTPSEFVSGLKLTVTTSLWIGYLFLLGMRLSNRLYGSRFAKWSIGLFALAALLSMVSSKSKKQAFYNSTLEPLALISR